MICLASWLLADYSFKTFCYVNVARLFHIPKLSCAKLNYHFTVTKTVHIAQSGINGRLGWAPHSSVLAQGLPYCLPPLLLRLCFMSFYCEGNYYICFRKVFLKNKLNLLYSLTVKK